ncbi:MAG: PepSY domain-containing protein [Caulobacteraceae bacterium]|jgi:uncharacterized membrane protein YkoI|nr:PepSY domain-containing protein [Caulobacteraceae bacterium]
MNRMSSPLLVLFAVAATAVMPREALARSHGLVDAAMGVMMAAAGPDSLGAGWRQQQGEAREAVQSGRAIPLGRVMEQIRRRTPGRPLDAGMEQSGGRAVYRVRWAAEDGRRIDYIVDAETGAILRADGE